MTYQPLLLHIRLLQLSLLLNLLYRSAPPLPPMPILYLFDISN
jgi:hypothetical protein